MEGKTLLIFLLAALIVIVLNVVLYAMARDPRRIRFIRSIQKTAGLARDPWKEEQNNLEELAELVKGLDSEQKEDEP